MKIALLLVPFFCSPACVTPDASLHAAPQGGQGQAVEAVFVRGVGGDFHDADPVAARAASFGKVVPSVDASPVTDRLRETLPHFVTLPVRSTDAAPSLSVDVVDSDPLAARGWR